MSYYVIIRGPLGIGKSVIARYLAERLHGKYISMDELLEEFGLDKSSEKEGCIPAKNFIEADKKVLPELKKNLGSGKIVVIDGCFYHKEQINHLKDELRDYRGYIFTLKASIETCIERDKGRKRVYGEGAARAVHYLVSRFDSGIVIDDDKKIAEDALEDILSYLPKS